MTRDGDRLLGITIHKAILEAGTAALDLERAMDAGDMSLIRSACDRVKTYAAQAEISAKILSAGVVAWQNREPRVRA